MALTFTEKVRQRMGRKRYHVFEITHDGSATTIDASSVGLNYIDYALATSKTALSSVADLARLSTTAGESIQFGGALSSGAVDVVQFWGT
jgi:hypothetical protein